MQSPVSPLKITLVLSCILFGVLPNARSSGSNLSPIVTKLPHFKTLYAYRPPAPPRRVSSPGRRSDGGSRTGCAGNLGKPLVALVPVYEPQKSELVYGVTTLAHPTFWFYLPYQAATNGTFQLRDENKKTIYETQLALPKTPGVIRFTLPDSAPALEVGKPYHWYFKASCETATDFVDGWIQRNSLSANLQKQLEQVTLQERSRLYSDNGIWFEALTTAAELKRADPKNQEWATLLKAVGLESIAPEPISDCCKVGDR